MNRAEKLFYEIIDECVKEGRIRFVSTSADVVLGREMKGGCDSSEEVVVRIHNARFFRRVLSHANLGLAESYMDGDFDIESGTLQDLLTVLLASRIDKKLRSQLSLLARLLSISLLSKIRGKQGNVRLHYDLGNDLYEAFLDDTLTYSCGYAMSEDDTLESLQANKLDRICRKTRLEAGQLVLDIGCGYGGFLMYAARKYGIRGLGVTNSEAHFERGVSRIAGAGMAGDVRLTLGDYRQVKGTFDRVVSIGMLEHVPRSEYRSFFRHIAAALRETGIGLVHSIASSTADNSHDPFIQKYIFPGSGLPRLSEISSLLERNKLYVTDVENMGRHYEFTLLHWLRRFNSNSTFLDAGKYDRRFVRMWKYYLSAGIAAARASENAVYQVLFVKDYPADLPLHRV